MAKLILFNKPFHVLSQFTPPKGDPDNVRRATLADWIDIPQIYPAGRLDYDSEGLLLLTDNGRLQHRISSPNQKMPKTYWVQVEGDITDKALRQLENGVKLKDGMTTPAKVKPMPEPDTWERVPPVRHRPSIPTNWLEITITEGRNRQVRRMTAAVGLPTLRLIRYRIGDWTLDGLTPGEHRIIQVNLPTTSTQRRQSSHSPKPKFARRSPKR
ncbi:pseudouridine synthase [Marinobacter sp. chi1]|uniref:Pseudouridine synthase n=1 Tax=Marinobacter suaedae TaxID=3057675 RepID=A0ABT8W2Q8_9GAMM|nr:pseudouridine synthase [Marinobacter sp. chi1]MDO3722496.1 pseudouridine synthase [Marinobacter sp. chi1]